MQKIKIPKKRKKGWKTNTGINMINSIKLNVHFSSETTGKNAFPQFEENQKKPEGCF